jgi:RecB family endonuclease NucS
MIGSNIFTQAEVSVSSGRIDLIIHTEKTLYIVELKRDKSATIALSQIKEKQYANAFLDKGKAITLVGVNFSTEKKNIGEWTSEEFSIE